ncbi:pyridoxamine 5'-phosphate oxidase [Quadrisphaera sp. INWT6]|uniref:pyridoxamine 5'-phosphate oxidase n=1 Tax=Quadrisphaera sp. INWT6 TaxID=2596917 RepID=UPI00281600C9|nr:pyridoxamine 5'-phosphate oxidase [Quadrisphaera sp. INWT6]
MSASSDRPAHDHLADDPADDLADDPAADRADLDAMHDLRVDYRLADAEGGLDAADLAPSPLEQFRRWWAEVAGDDAAAGAPRVVEPNAVVLATADADGLPDARTVLLKDVDARGFVIYTNLRSAKAQQLAAVPHAALVLPWHAVQRQVRVRGAVEQVSRAESAAYFATRPRGSQLGAHASAQSRPVAGRAELQRALDEAAARWPEGVEVPLPDHWGGYLVRPVELELWVGRPSRLHDRLAYVSATGGPAPLDDPAAWRVERRQP